MKTKVILFVAAIVAFFSVDTMAQGGPGPKDGKRGGGPRMDSAQVIKEVDELSKSLSLSADQKSKILDIKLAQFNEMKANMKKPGGEKPSGDKPKGDKAKGDKKAEKGEKGEKGGKGGEDAMKASQEKTEAAILKVLNDEQKTKYQSLKKDHKKGPRPDENKK